MSSFHQHGKMETGLGDFTAKKTKKHKPHLPNFRNFEHVLSEPQFNHTHTHTKIEKIEKTQKNKKKFTEPQL